MKKKLAFAGLTALLATAWCRAENPFVINGRLIIPGVTTLDGLVVQQSPDGASGWTEVTGFTRPNGAANNDYAFGPDQSLDGVSYWRISTDGGTTWSELGAIDARHRLTGTALGTFGGNGGLPADGNPATFADDYSNPSWWGLDFGKSCSVVRLAFVPRYIGSWSFLDRVKNLEVHISDDADFATYEVLYSQGGVNAATGVTVVDLATPAEGRYVRVVGAEYGNFSEMEFDYDPDVISLDSLSAACGNYGSGAARIAWNREASSQGGVCLYRAEGGGEFTLIAELGKGVTEYLDEDVSPSHFYRYAVALRNAAGEPGEIQGRTATYTCMRRLERSVEDPTRLRNGYSLIHAGASYISISPSMMFDGSTSTYPDMWNDDRPMIGVDFGEGGVHVAVCRFYPRTGMLSRGAGIVVYGSNSEDWSAEGNATALCAVGPTLNEATWYELTCDSSEAYRDVFVQSATQGWCGNLSEVEFYGWDDTDVGETLFAPSDFRAVRGTTGAALSWYGCAKAEKYEVERRTGTDGEWTKVGETTATTWTEDDPSLVVGAVYSYRAVAVAGVESLASEPQTVTWYPAGRGTGLLGCYYRYYDFGNRTREPELVRCAVDAQVNFNWANETLVSNVADCNDSMRVVWTGRLIVPADGDYVFKFGVDDGCMAWLDGEPLASVSCADYTTSARTLTAGEHPLRIEYMERGSGARMTFAWSGFMGEEPVPSSQLVPAEAPEAVPEPWNGWRSVNQLYYGGYVSFGEDGAVTMDTSGGGLSGTTEGYTFLDTAFTGDFVARCRYEHASSADFGQLAMLMVRAALTNGAPFMAVAAKGTAAGAAFGVKLRAAEGAEIANAVEFGETEASAAGGGLKIVRRGNVFSWFVRAGSGGWRPLGTWTDEDGVFGSTVSVGLAGTVEAASYDQRVPSRIGYADFSIGRSPGLSVWIR